MTPEGRIKASVKKVLAEFGPDLWQHWPVQNGMGKPCLDAHCCYLGVYFAIETKAPGQALTPRQKGTALLIERANGKVFIVDGAVSLNAMKEWLQSLQETMTWSETSKSVESITPST